MQKLVCCTKLYVPKPPRCPKWRQGALSPELPNVETIVTLVQTDKRAGPDPWHRIAIQRAPIIVLCSQQPADNTRAGCLQAITRLHMSQATHSSRFQDGNIR